MVTLLRAVTEFRTSILTKRYVISNFVEWCPRGDTVRLTYRVHDEPDGRSMVCEETATSADTPWGSFIVADEYAAWGHDL
jgi:hypothetical protein